MQTVTFRTNGLECLRVVNAKGRPFVATIINQGDPYGRDGCLTHEGIEPLIEFHDATYEDEAEKFGDHTGERGQFVSRYYLGTILEADGGLNLDGGIDEWKIDQNTMYEVRRWARTTESRKAS